jgi:hypothetical protein
MTPDLIPSPNPNALQVYDIVAIDRIEDVDGYWWIEAATACGHRISVASHESVETIYQVHVSVGDTPSTYRTVRYYRGGEGSDAERVFKTFHAHYLKASGGA